MLRLKSGTVTGAAVALALIATTGAASAETLREALIKAYQSNPTMTGARAGLKATDEDVVIARAQGRPSLVVDNSYTENLMIPPENSTRTKRTYEVTPRISVPIYQGGSVRNAIKAADIRVKAGQAGLRDTESSIFASVVGVYMDVIRDSAIVALRKSNVGVLETNLQATKDRFDVGDLTRTDIAQSQSRLATARSDLQSSEAQLITSKERYIQLVGSAPANLEPPPPLPNLPEAPDGAVDIALSQNPDLQSAQYRRDAAKYDVNAAMASRLPSITGVGNLDYRTALGSFASNVGSNSAIPIDQAQTTASIGVRLSVPLYQGGGPSGKVRRARAIESQSIEQQIEVERRIIADTRAFYAGWRAANEVINSSMIAVDASRLSLEGVRAENSVGSRSILDILNAEQEYLNSQVQLVTARRDAYVAGFSLLAAMGQAEAKDLGLEGGTLYDPNSNYKKSRGTIFDWDTGPKPEPVATRTVDTEAQSPSVLTTPEK